MQVSTHISTRKPIAAVLSGTVQPRLYLDTNVILDAIPPVRWQPSADLIKRIQREHWQCTTSRYTFMEMLDEGHKQRYIDNLLAEGYLLDKVRDLLGVRRQKAHELPLIDLEQVYAKLYDVQNTILSCVRFEYPKTPDYWDKADKYCATTCIDPDDAIHLAMAKESECNILVTRDKDFKAIASDYIIAIEPEEIETALKKLSRKG
jgi:predicted nucleic acid-binding protein